MSKHIKGPMLIAYVIGALLATNSLYIQTITQEKVDEDPPVFDPLKADEAISILNKKLNKVVVKKSGLPQLTGSKPQAQYLITIKEEFLNTVHYFDIHDYTLETGGRTLQMGTSGVCALIDSINKRSNPVTEALDQIEVSVGFSLFGFVEFEIDGLEGLISELGMALLELYRIESEDIRILVKGYADGSQQSDWTRDIKPYPYDYAEISYFPTLIENSLNPVQYVPQAQIHTIEDGVYTNVDLPNLRANFIANDFIIPFLSQCSQKNVSVNILEGYEFEQPNQPLNRMVEIYIQYF